MHQPALLAAITAALAALPSAQAGGLYPKSSPVLQVDGKSYQRLIADSNYTSVCLTITDHFLMNLHLLT